MAPEETGSEEQGTMETKSLAPAPNADFLRELAAIDARITETQAPIIAELQAVLDRYAGQSFGSFEGNHEVARLIQRIFMRLDAKAICPNTRDLASIIHKNVGNARNGAFQLSICSDGKRRETYTRVALPDLHLVSAIKPLENNQVPTRNPHIVGAKQRSEMKSNGEAMTSQNSQGERRRPVRPGALALRMQSETAFKRALPGLLQTHRGQFAAFHGDECIAIMSSKGELNQECIGRGLQPSQFIIREILPQEGGADAA